MSGTNTNIEIETVNFSSIKVGNKFKSAGNPQFIFEKISESTGRIVGTPHSKRNMVGETRIFPPGAQVLLLP